MAAAGIIAGPQGAAPVKGVVQPFAPSAPAATGPGFSASVSGLTPANNNLPQGANTPGYIGSQIPVQLSPGGPMMVKGPGGNYVQAAPYGPAYGVSPSTPTSFTPSSPAPQTEAQSLAANPTPAGVAGAPHSNFLQPTPGPTPGDTPTGVNPTGYNAPGAAQGAGAGGGMNPYDAILKADPAYAQAENDAQQSAADAASNRTAAIRQAVLQFGGLAPGTKDTYGDVNAATLAAASANPYSEMAQNQRAFGQTQEKQLQGAAANGSIFSGQEPTDLGNQDYQHGLDLQTLGQNFSQSVGTAVGNFTNTLATNKTNLTNALFAAEKNQQTNPAYTGAFNPTTPAKTPSRFSIAPHHLEAHVNRFLSGSHGVAP